MIKAMDLKLTAVFQKVPEGYIGFVEELPGANTQGATLERPGRIFRKPSRWCLKPIGSCCRKQPAAHMSSVSR